MNKKDIERFLILSSAEPSLEGIYLLNSLLRLDDASFREAAATMRSILGGGLLRTADQGPDTGMMQMIVGIILLFSQTGGTLVPRQQIGRLKQILGILVEASPRELAFQVGEPYYAQWSRQSCYLALLLKLLIRSGHLVSPEGMRCSQTCIIRNLSGVMGVEMSESTVHNLRHYFASQGADRASGFFRSLEEGARAWMAE